MPKSIDHPHRSRTGSWESHTPCPDGSAHPTGKPTRRGPADGRHLLDRILNTPRLEQVVPRLPPDLLHRVIKSCGLEDCSELVALATSEQLARIFDLDLWRAGRPGMDEQFDADRFGVWIEVLVESGAEVAARKLAGTDADIVAAGLARQVLVYDRAAVMPYETLDGEQMEVSHAGGDGLTFDVGGYLLVAKRTDSWDAIIEVLLALSERHRDYFHQVMGRCRLLSNAGREVDGLDDLLAAEDQAMFDLAVDREGRREKQGYVAPAEAREFLQMARDLRLGPDAVPPVSSSANPIVGAYLRAQNDRMNEGMNERLGANADSDSMPLVAESQTLPAAEDIAEGVATVFDVLLEAGVLDQSPRGLLSAPDGHATRLGRIQVLMQSVLEQNQTAYSARNDELVYLANTLMAGCSIQARPFTAREASDAAAAVCNLGLENWPPHWLPANTTSLPSSFLVDHDLISVFQVGWAVLHKDVSMYAAEHLIEVLTRIRCDDREIQTWLDGLRIQMAKHCRARAPWRARDALDVIAILDTTAWAVLLDLIDEFPVLHTAAGASKDPRTVFVSASDFEFISENGQIASVREFMQSLPQRLCS
ncbi:MAG TPA: DUF6178 family protein [Blastocatellia bacterium]|nr:DUF6178 family protein [Blastocatellia bacterium]